MHSGDRISRTPLDNAATARAGDTFTIETLGVAGIALMEMAGRGAYEAIVARYPDRPLIVVAGPGNNGGDGYVVARHALHFGVPCKVLCANDASGMRGDGQAARTAFDNLLAQGRHGVALQHVIEPLTPASLAAALDTATLRDAVIVDALFGTGLSRPVEGSWASIFETLASAPNELVSLDIPSGLYADGRRPDGHHLRADFTVTFGRRKIAHAASPTALWCGEVAVVDAGIIFASDAPPAYLAELRPLPTRARHRAQSRTAHKGSFGHVGVLQGSAGLVGASTLSAQGALRAGSGKVSLLGTTSTTHRPPEIMHRGLPDTGAVDLSGLNALVVGPGLGQTPGAQQRAAAVLAAADTASIPVVVDADGLFIPHALPPTLRVVLTPHPGEAARLLGESVASIQGDRMAAAARLAEHFPTAVVVLKGAAPVIATRDDPPVIVRGFTPALAVGGSGDVLSGVIAAALCNTAPLDAAILGVLIHQRAGRLLTERAARGHSATDIANAVRDAAFGRWS